MTHYLTFLAATTLFALCFGAVAQNRRRPIVGRVVDTHDQPIILLFMILLGVVAAPAWAEGGDTSILGCP